MHIVPTTIATMPPIALPPSSSPQSSGSASGAGRSIQPNRHASLFKNHPLRPHTSRALMRSSSVPAALCTSRDARRRREREGGNKFSGTWSPMPTFQYGLLASILNRCSPSRRGSRRKSSGIGRICATSSGEAVRLDKGKEGKACDWTQDWSRSLRCHALSRWTYP